MHLIYLIHKFHNLSWITEINELFHYIIIDWDAPVHEMKQKYHKSFYGFQWEMTDKLLTEKL